MHLLCDGVHYIENGRLPEKTVRTIKHILEGFIYYYHNCYSTHNDTFRQVLKSLNKLSKILHFQNISNSLIVQLSYDDSTCRTYRINRTILHVLGRSQTLLVRQTEIKSMKIRLPVDLVFSQVWPNRKRLASVLCDFRWIPRIIY